MGKVSVYENLSDTEHLEACAKAIREQYFLARWLDEQGLGIQPGDVDYRYLLTMFELIYGADGNGWRSHETENGYRQPCELFRDLYKGPELAKKLGIVLNGIEDRDEACITLPNIWEREKPQEARVWDFIVGGAYYYLWYLENKKLIEAAPLQPCDSSDATTEELWGYRRDLADLWPTAGDLQIAGVPLTYEMTVYSI